MSRVPASGSRGERRTRMRTAWPITATYIAIGAAWIILTDVASMGLGGEPLITVSLIKGIFWIVSSGLFLHILVFKRIERARAFEESVRRRLVEGEELGRFGVAEMYGGETQARWSEGMFRLWGVSPRDREPDARWLLERIHPDDLARVRSAGDAAGRGETSPPYEFRIRAADGVERTLHVTTKAERQNDGRVRMLLVAHDVSEIRALEKNASESLTLLRSVMESTADGMMVVRVDTREILLWNDRFTELMRVPRRLIERLDATALREAFLANVRHPERVSAWIEEIYARPDIECTDLIEMIDGSILERHTAPVVLRDGPPARIWSYRDVTERIRASEALARREQQLRDAQELAHVGSYEWNLETNELRWSEELYRIYGLEMRGDALPVESVARMTHPDDAARVEGLLAAAREGLTIEAATFRIVRPDGTVRVVEGRGRRTAVPDGRSSVLMGVVRDVTEEHAWRRQVDLLLNSTEAGLFTVDLEGRCTLINRAARESLGYSEEEILGKPLRDVVYGPSKIVPGKTKVAIERANGGTPTKFYDHDFMRKDGSRFPCDVTISPVVEDGRIIGRAVSFIDVSDRIRLERQLEDAKRLSSLGRLAASIAHEINNVLMGILPFAEIVSRSLEPTLRRAGEQIRQSVQRGRGVTQEILRFARQEAPHRQLFDARAWLHSIAGELQHIGGLGWSMTVPEEPFFLDADPQQLAQVLINLVLNARDAVAAGTGRITLTVHLSAPGTAYPFGALPATAHRWVAFQVADNGSGMDAETLRHLFEPFFTKKRGGTGLGLPIAYRIIAAHEGLFFVESEEGRGSTFYIFLPEAPPAPPEDDRDRRAAVDLHGTVLIVEDDETVASGLAFLLDEAGMRPLVVGTGAAALAEIERGRPSLIILDIGLPDMDGSTVCQRALERWPGLPIVISTGHGEESRLGDCLGKANVRFLRKPYTFDTLRETIEKAIER